MIKGADAPHDILPGFGKLQHGAKPLNVGLSNQLRLDQTLEQLPHLGLLQMGKQSEGAEFVEFDFLDPRRL